MNKLFCVMMITALGVGLRHRSELRGHGLTGESVLTPHGLYLFFMLLVVLLIVSSRRCPPSCYRKIRRQAVPVAKRAAKTALAEAESVGDTVKKILDEIEAGGEDVARQGRRTRPAAQRGDRGGVGRVATKDDIAFAHDNVRRFAERQRDTIQDIEMEVVPGLVAGQRLIPVSSAGCYIPGGRYSHIASAIMTVTTARVAGVQHITACSPPRKDVGIAPAIVHAAKVCGANLFI